MVSVLKGSIWKFFPLEEFPEPFHFLGILFHLFFGGRYRVGRTDGSGGGLANIFSSNPSFFLCYGNDANLKMSV